MSPSAFPDRPRRRPRPVPRGGHSRARFSSVVVGTDFSIGAARAAARAARLPLASGAVIHLLHVCAPPPRRDRWTAAWRDRAAEALDREASALQRRAPGSVEVRAVLKDDVDASAAILGTARSVRAGLVVLGRHGTRTVPRLLIGSTVERVSRKAKVPILIVHRGPRRAYRRIVVGVDEGPAARLALRTAVRLAGPGACRLRLVRAVAAMDVTALLRAGASAADVGRYRARELRDAAGTLRRCRSKLASGQVAWEEMIRWGDARSILGSLAEDARVDLVAVGMRGAGTSALRERGHVAGHIFLHAKTDLLMAPA